MRQFDLNAFKRGWRQVCAEQGIDPLTGEHTRWRRGQTGETRNTSEAEAYRNIAAQAAFSVDQLALTPIEWETLLWDREWLRITRCTCRGVRMAVVMGELMDWNDYVRSADYDPDDDVSAVYDRGRCTCFRRYTVERLKWISLQAGVAEDRVIGILNRVSDKMLCAEAYGVDITLPGQSLYVRKVRRIQRKHAETT